MAESYFELLTEQDGIPAKPFNAVEELKGLRRRLALRLQTSEFTEEKTTDPTPSRPEVCPAKIETNDIVPFALDKAASPEIEPISLESVMEKTSNMKKTLVIWQRSRIHAKQVRNDAFRSDLYRGRLKALSRKQDSSVVAQFLTTPQEETLEIVNAGLVALGIIGVVFGFLSYWRGIESDLSFGSLVCATGAAIVAIGIGGRLFASRSELSRS